MSALQKKMAEYGFESNDDYEYHVRCLLSRPTDTIRCFNVQGESDRRKTAFANALANALEFPHVLYYDFTQVSDPFAKATLLPSKDENGLAEKEVDVFDRVVSEACAFSEGDDTILIIDQLQVADFRDHIRLYEFLKSSQWLCNGTNFVANPERLLLFLIAEGALYHSLQKMSFRVWVNASSGKRVDYKPEDFALSSEAWGVMETLALLFEKLGVVPTFSEYEKIIHDIHFYIRTIDYLKYSIYGWTEGIEQSLLDSAELQPFFAKVMIAIESYIGMDEVELVDPMM